MLSIGHIERQMGHLDRAQDVYQAAQQIYRTHNNAQGLGNVALALGHVEFQRGDLRYAAEHYQDAIGYFKHANDSLNEVTLAGVADIQRMARQFAEAERAYQRALTIYQTHKDNFGTVDAKVGLARIYIEQERFDEATNTLSEALNLASMIQYKLVLMLTSNGRNQFPANTCRSGSYHS